VGGSRAQRLDLNGNRPMNTATIRFFYTAVEKDSLIAVSLARLSFFVIRLPVTVAFSFQAKLLGY